MMDLELETYRRLWALRAHAPWPCWPDELREGLRHSARALANRGEAVGFPPVLYIEPTNACNCNCVICPRQNMTRPIGRMSFDLFEKIVDEAAALGPSEINLFNFGEPTLHPRLADMIRVCRDRKLPVAFQTNGLIIKEDMVRQWLDAGLTRLGISVNGLNAAEYETIRPGHSHAALRANLFRLREIVDSSGKPFEINIAAQIEKADLTARREEIEQYKRAWFGVADSLSIFGVSVYDHIFSVSEGKTARNVLTERPRKADSEIACVEPFDRLIVKWDGRATVCCVDFDARMPVGDLNTQSLEEAWNSSRLNNIRSIMRARAYSRLPLCRTCPKFYSDSFTLYFKKTKPVVRQSLEAEISAVR